jgi:hypothetical protein
MKEGSDKIVQQSYNHIAWIRRGVQAADQNIVLKLRNHLSTQRTRTAVMGVEVVRQIKNIAT